MLMMMSQSVYLNERRAVVMELDKNCNKNTRPLADGLAGLQFTKLGKSAYVRTTLTLLFGQNFCFKVK